MKTRAEREAELQLLASTDKGKWQLTDMTKLYLGMAEGQTIPISTLLIYVILNHEFGDDQITADKISED